MHWLIQRKFDYDPNYRKLLSNLERLNIPHSYCKVVPFTDDGIEWEDVPPESHERCFASGSYTLAKIAKKYYYPGSFISENLNLDNLLEHWKDEMFNSDMQFATIRTADFTDTDLSRGIFIRPVEDTKSFCGGKMTYDEFTAWKQKLSMLKEDEFSTVDLDTRICWAKPKPIDYEVRFFIVDGKPVTWSEYKRGGQVGYKKDVDYDILYYVCGLVGDKPFNLDSYQPDKAYVLDIAVTDGVPKILEANSINAVGLYACDTQKLIMALEDLEYHL